MNILFVGGGNMARALIGGLLRRGGRAQDIGVVEIAADARDRLAREFGITTFAHLGAAPELAPVIVLAVKPQQLSMVARGLAPLLSSELVVSIAAGIRTRDIARWLNGYACLVRVMPNTPALVGVGISGLYAMPEVSADQKRRAQDLLDAVGATLWVSEEQALDAITAVSGSGPAYVFYFIQALEQAAIALGLTAVQARTLSLHTFRGAAEVAAVSKEDLRALRAAVTSKGGTTECALLALEEAGVGESIVAAVLAACARAKELGDELGALG